MCFQNRSFAKNLILSFSCFLFTNSFNKGSVSMKRIRQPAVHNGPGGSELLAEDFIGRAVQRVQKRHKYLKAGDSGSAFNVTHMTGSDSNAFR